MSSEKEQQSIATWGWLWYSKEGVGISDSDMETSTQGHISIHWKEGQEEVVRPVSPREN